MPGIKNPRITTTNCFSWATKSRNNFTMIFFLVSAWKCHRIFLTRLKSFSFINLCFFFPVPFTEKQKLIVPVTIDKIFKQSLKDPRSKDFKSLATEMEKDLKPLLCDIIKFYSNVVHVLSDSESPSRARLCGGCLRHFGGLKKSHPWISGACTLYISLCCYNF